MFASCIRNSQAKVHGTKIVFPGVNTVHIDFSVGVPPFTSSFHVVDEIIDPVDQGASLPSPPIGGVQTVSASAAQ
jgi:hypothetical protein